MAKLQGADKLIKQFEDMAKKLGSKKVSVSVGYTQNYAIYVHEDLEAHHDVGQAKFLEQPFRENRDEYVGIMTKAVLKGADLEKAALMAGLKLQRDSQLLVPVDTGALKSSAFTRLG